MLTSPRCTRRWQPRLTFLFASAISNHRQNTVMTHSTTVPPAGSAGGGILSEGALTLRNVIMTDNTCGFGGGGAVKSAGARLNIISSKTLSIAYSVARICH
jgi:hypothetical protein